MIFFELFDANWFLTTKKDTLNWYWKVVQVKKMFKKMYRLHPTIYKAKQLPIYFSKQRFNLSAFLVQVVSAMALSHQLNW